MDTLFRTSVQDAVLASLQQKKPLFVFLTKNDEPSRKFAEQYLGVGGTEEHGGIMRKIQGGFISLKLIDNTIEFGYFREILKHLQVPSFYIVNKGALLDVITGECELEQFVERLDKVLEGSKASSRQISPESGSAILEEPRSPVSRIVRENGTLLSAHDRSVNQHMKEIDSVRKKEQEERKRMRALLDADKKERQLKRRESQSASSESPVPIKKEASRQTKHGGKYYSCSLAIRLFDGKSLKHDFKADQTLNDVRSWLDTETNNQIIADPNTSLPSFATSSNPQPTHYVFHRPALPRITYTDEEEFKKLIELELCPRSALILKPIYDDRSYSSAYPSRKHTGGVFRSMGGAIGRLGGALYSFFDYSVDDLQDHDSQSESGRPRSPLNESDEVPGRSSDANSINETPPHTSGSSRPDEYFESIRNNAGTPSVVAIDSESQPASLINFRDNISPQLSRTSSVPPLEASFSNDVMPNYNGRSSAPKPISSTPSMSNIQTIRDDYAEPKNASTSKKDRRTYNGNNINIKDHKDD